MKVWVQQDKGMKIMHQRDFVSSIIKRHGIQFRVLRKGISHAEVGAPDNYMGAQFFNFAPSADILVGDILENPAADQYFVVDVETKYAGAEAAYLCVSYKTKAQHEHDEKQATVFNIQNAYGSVIGNQNQTTINYNSTIDELKKQIASENSEDKEELEKVVALLEMVVNNQVPPSKGLFSKFSALMERHSWISSAVAGVILSWLTTQIP